MLDCVEFYSYSFVFNGKRDVTVTDSSSSFHFDLVLFNSDRYVIVNVYIFSCDHPHRD